MKVCRIEKWRKDPDGEVRVGEYDTIYYLAINKHKKHWYDGTLKPITNPLAFKGYNLKEFYKCVTETWKHENGMLCELKYYGTFNTPEYAYDIIFKEEGVMPYNKYLKQDIKEEITEKIRKGRIKMNDATKIRMIKNLIDEYHKGEDEDGHEIDIIDTMIKIEKVSRQ